MNSANEWRMVKLEDICAIEVGKTPARKNPLYWGPGHPWLSIRDMNQGAEIYYTRETITDAAVDKANMKLRPAGSVLFSFKLSIGKVAIAKIPLFTNEAIAALTPIDEGIIDRSYLAHFLRAVGPGLQGNRAVMGTTLNKRSLGEIDIPLPPLAEQQRIAEMLDEATSVCRLRGQVLERLNELEASLFEDLAEKTNDTMASLSSLEIDFTAGKNIVASSGSSHPVNQVVKVSAVSSGVFNPTESKPLPADYSPPERHRIEKGDVLFGRASGTLELIGATCLVNQEVDHLYLPDKVWKLEVGENSPVDPLFVYYSLRSRRSRSYFRNQASGASGVRNISKKKVLQLEIPVPSPDVQHSFLEETHRIRETKQQAEELLKLDKELFHSLSTRAFARQL